MRGMRPQYEGEMGWARFRCHARMSMAVVMRGTRRPWRKPFFELQAAQVQPARDLPIVVG